MLYVFGDHQQGTCAAGIRQVEDAVGSSKSLNIEICKRLFSEKRNTHFFKVRHRHFVLYDKYN